MTISKITVQLYEFRNDSIPVNSSSWYNSLTNIISLTYNYAFSTLSYWKNSSDIKTITLDINKLEHSDNNPTFIINKVHDIIFTHISKVCIPTNASIIDHNMFQYSHMEIEIDYFDNKNNQFTRRYSYDYHAEKNSVNKLHVLKNAVSQAEEIITNDSYNLETYINVVQLDIGFDKLLFA